MRRSRSGPHPALPPEFGCGPLAHRHEHTSPMTAHGLLRPEDDPAAQLVAGNHGADTRTFERASAGFGRRLRLARALVGQLAARGIPVRVAVIDELLLNMAE